MQGSTKDPQAVELGVLQRTSDAVQPYKLYRRRFVGLFGLFMLNVVAAMAWPWFGPIADNTATAFDITLNEVNWLGNIICCVYIPSIVLVPWIVSRYGIRRSCQLGGFFLVSSAWIRYAGTTSTLSSGGSYALLIISQFLSAISQVIYQVLAPKYSETWFGLKGRTTATMIVAVANPVGTALGQLISPLISTPRGSVLVLGIIGTAASPCIFLIGDKPPTPPTFAAEQAQDSHTISFFFRRLVGLKKKTESDAEFMTTRQRVDFVILCSLFGMLAAVINTFSILSSQYLAPYGYSDTISGLMGATLILSGIVAAGFSAPLFDRVFTNHLALTVRVLGPILGLGWLSLIWAIRPNNTGALFAIFAVIGICSLTLLPVALELGVELTRVADASSAMLWGISNALTVMFILAEPALGAGPNGSPPNNLYNAIIFQACFLCVTAVTLIPFKGEQTRRKQDVDVELEMTAPPQVVVSPVPISDETQGRVSP